MARKSHPAEQSSEIVAMVSMPSSETWMEAPVNPVTPGNGTERWAADVELNDGAVTMCDWATLEDAQVVDPLGREMDHEELRARLGLEVEN